MAFAHAFQYPSLETPAIASTRGEIIRGFIPLVVAIALLHALAALALPYTSIHISPSTWLALLLVCATCSAASLCCLRLVFAPAICTGLALFGIIVLAGRGGLMLSYMTSSLGRSFPLRDSVLAAFDLTLGFEWTAMLAWSDRYPMFTEIGRYAYDSLIYQQVIVPFVLILFRQYLCLQRRAEGDVWRKLSDPHLVLSAPCPAADLAAGADALPDGLSATPCWGSRFIS